MSPSIFCRATFFLFCKQDLPCPFGFRFCLSCLSAFSGCQPTCFLIVTAPASDSSALPYAFFPWQENDKTAWEEGSPMIGISPLRSIHQSDPKPNPPSYHVLRVSVPLLRRLFPLRTNYRTRPRHLSEGLSQRARNPKNSRPSVDNSSVKLHVFWRTWKLAGLESENCICFC